MDEEEEYMHSCRVVYAMFDACALAASDKDVINAASVLRQHESAQHAADLERIAALRKALDWIVTASKGNVPLEQMGIIAMLASERAIDALEATK